MAKVALGNKAKEVFTDAMHAAVYLQERGIVDNASYLWNLCKVVKNADQMIINMATYIANTDR